MERQISELSGKIKTLKFRRSKTSEILKKRDRQASERQKESIINISKAVNELKETIEEKKLAKGKDDRTVAEWSKQYESEVEEADEDITILDQQIKEIDNNDNYDNNNYEQCGKLNIVISCSYRP